MPACVIHERISIVLPLPAGAQTWVTRRSPRRSNSAGRATTPDPSGGRSAWSRRSTPGIFASGTPDVQSHGSCDGGSHPPAAPWPALTQTPDREGNDVQDHGCRWRDDAAGSRDIPRRPTHPRGVAVLVSAQGRRTTVRPRGEIDLASARGVE